MNRVYFFWLIVAVANVASPTNLVEAGLLSPNGDEQYERLDQPWNIGFSFLVNDEPVAINALGVWEDFDGLDNEIVVGIWSDFEEDPIAVAVVPSGQQGILDDGFRYSLIDTIELEPGEEYVVGALVSYDGDAFNDPYNIANDLTASGFDIDSRVEWLQNRFEFGTDEFGDLAFRKPVRDGTGGVGRWAGGNATFLDVDVEPNGDFNQNGDLDANDIDLLTDQINSAINDASFDLTADGEVNRDDFVSWVKDFKSTWIGDSNLDGEFNSTDFVTVFGSGEYEDATPMNSGWSEGDWNGDQDFNSTDFVAAFSDGGYEKGSRPAQAVPEPKTSVLMVGISFWGFQWRRSNRAQVD